MKYFESDGSVIMTDQDSFDIEQILECGQCFRFEKLSEKEYRIVAMGRVLTIKQDKDSISFSPCSEKDFREIWYEYFDLGRDYTYIKELLSVDEVMRAACDFGSGIRILNQEPFECLVSFIISQNNRIPMIKKAVRNISEKWGTQRDGEYLFPSPEALLSSDRDSLMECKTGFRHKYISDCLEKIAEKSICLEELKGLPTDRAREELMKIKGVGVKVADCVLLFSLGKSEVFPTDVWIKRVMEYFWPSECVSMKEIQSFAREKWGIYAGFAQQYLFYYARSLSIGKTK